MKKPKHKKRQRPGVIARTIRLLDRWYTFAQKDKNGHGESVAILQFMEAHIQPYKERGDAYVKILSDIVNQTPALTSQDAPNRWTDLPGRIKIMADHLTDLLEGSLNYEDMREALRAVIAQAEAELTLDPEPKWHYLVRRSLAGSSESDLGKMRLTLHMADDTLTDILKSERGEGMSNTVVMEMWEVIHAARKALAAAPGPDELERLRAEAHEVVSLRFFLAEAEEKLRVLRVPHEVTYTCEVTTASNDASRS